MAKQDLVVKLLLDSGAFGNDLRQAERKAQEFSNKMQGAGKTVGELGNELNIVTGAFGKLSGVLTGGAAVVAAFGAFKSVMESTHETSKKFHGTLDGISGVFKEIQQSLATMDFTNWNNGASIFQSYRDVSISNADLGISQTAYDMLNADNMKDIKKLMADFTAATTKEAKQEIKDEILKVLDEMLGQFGNLSVEIDDNIIKNIIAGSGIQRSQITPEFAKEQIDKVYKNINSGAKKDDLALWETVNEQLEQLDALKNNADTAYKQSLSNASQYPFQRDFYLEQAEKFKKQYAEYDKQRREYFNKNLDIIFRKQLYDMPAEEFSQLSGKKIGADNEAQRLAELRREISTMPVEVPKQPTPGGGEDKKIVNKKDSIGWLKEQIAEQEKLRDSVKQGSAEWMGYTETLYEHKKALAEVEKEQEKYDAQYVTVTPKYEAGSLDEVKAQIAEQERLVNTLDMSSKEWEDATEQLRLYKWELEEMNKILNKALEEDLEPAVLSWNQEGSLGKVREDIALKREDITKQTALRDSYTFESDKWKAADETLKQYMADLQALLQLQAEYEGSTGKNINQLGNLNVLMGTSVSLLNGLGSAFGACEDREKQWVGAIMTSMGQAASGIMDFIQIKQAAAAASAASSAAGLPYPYNIAAIISAVATVTSIFGTIQSMTNAGKYAEGGIVGGTSYSGDKLFAMVNSGEMILNKRQQSNLSNMLGSGRDNSGGGQVEFHISGDTLVGVLNNKRNKTHLTR